MGPFKCPECGVWWVGLEHRCKSEFSSSTNYRLTLNGHCHGCSSAYCTLNDHVPCMQHQSGWTTS
jgi:hypothetical protein